MSAPNRALLALGLAACSPGSSSFPAFAPGVRIAPAQVAREHAKSSQHVAAPFRLDRAGVSGTALVLGYLEYAEGLGAKYVSDIAIVLDFVHNGVAVECVSRIAIDDGRAPPPAPEPAPADEPASDGEYSTTVRPWHPDVVSAWVIDRDLVCKKVGHQVIEPTPKFESRYDVEVKEYIRPRRMPVRNEAQIEWTDECHYEPARRLVTRYDHFIAARFAPPELPRIAAKYSDWKLVEEPPSCHQIDSSAKHVQRIEADLHFVGSLGHTKLPKVFTR